MQRHDDRFRSEKEDNMQRKHPLTAALSLAFSACLQAATVDSVGGSTVNVTSDPEASPAIRFNGSHVLSISTHVITGDIVGSQGNLNLNGSVTINGQIGASGAAIAFVSPGLNGSGVTARTADGDRYVFNGDAYINNLVINNGVSGDPYSSTVVFNGSTNQINRIYWESPVAGKIAEIDVGGNRLVAGTVEFRNSAGGLPMLTSTITAAGGQTGCSAGPAAGCISATTHGSLIGGASTRMPAGMQIRLRVANGLTLTTGSRYTLIDFASGTAAVPTLNTSISSLTTGFTFVQDTANTQDLVVEVTGVPVVVPLFRPRAGAVGASAAGVLDGLSATATDAGMIDAISALQGLDSTAQSAALRRIAPQTGRGVGDASSAALSGAMGAVAARLDSIRSQGFSLGLLDELRSGRLQVAGDGDLSSLIDHSSRRTRGIWIKGFGTRSRQAMRDGFAGYHGRGVGVAVGADLLLDTGWVLGAALSQARTDVDHDDFRSGDGSDIDSTQLTGYASRALGAAYLDAQLAWARHRYDSRRDTGVTGVAQGRHDGEQIAVRVGAGLPFDQGAITVTPHAALEWTRLQQDGYSEHGAGALSLTVDDGSAQRLRSVLGVRVATDASLPGDRVLRPSAHVSWRHDFRNEGIASQARFTGGGATFTTPGQSLARDVFGFGGALALQVSARGSVELRADHERGAGYSASSAQLTGRWVF